LIWTGLTLLYDDTTPRTTPYPAATATARPATKARQGKARQIREGRRKEVEKEETDEKEIPLSQVLVLFYFWFSPIVRVVRVRKVQQNEWNGMTDTLLLNEAFIQRYVAYLVQCSHSSWIPFH
jgi:hypothetical protein